MSNSPERLCLELHLCLPPWLRTSPTRLGQMAVSQPHSPVPAPNPRLPSPVSSLGAEQVAPKNSSTPDLYRFLRFPPQGVKTGIMLLSSQADVISWRGMIRTTASQDYSSKGDAVPASFPPECLSFHLRDAHNKGTHWLSKINCVK